MCLGIIESRGKISLSKYNKLTFLFFFSVYSFRPMHGVQQQHVPQSIVPDDHYQCCCIFVFGNSQMILVTCKTCNLR